MHVLIFLGNDASNLSIENIVRELDRRHEVKLVAPANCNPQQIQMFDDLAEKIIPMEECTDEVYDWADCVFCTVMSATTLRDCKKYIFSFCHMNPRFDEPRGYDFVFTLGELGEQDVPPYFASMPVGLAKNDAPVTAETKKQILYVDAGHFPFGKTGQRQIAQMLLNICAAYPEYNVCVKPRWFPGATDRDMSNQNYGHVYNELAELCPDGLPENLELLWEYRNLQELIDESTCVVSSCTSAYLDAAMRGKPLLIIKGIENEDMYHLRSEYFDNLYRFAQESGCVVDWREVTDYLPEGRMCAPEHINRSFSYLNGATARVVEAMEYICETFIEHGRFPDIKEYRYETYREQLTDDFGLSMEDLLTNRRFCATETAMVLTYKVSSSLNWQPYYQQQMALCRMSVNADGALKKLSNFSTLRKEILRLKCNYLVGHPGFVKNDVDASYLYYALSQCKKRTELMQLYQQTLENPHDSLLYYTADIYWELGQGSTAIENFKTYLIHSIERTYPKYITDTFSNRVHAFEKVLDKLAKQDKGEELLQFVDLFLLFAKRYPRDEYFKTNLLTQVYRKLVKLELGARPEAAALLDFLSAHGYSPNCHDDRSAARKLLERGKRKAKHLIKGAFKQVRTLGRKVKKLFKLVIKTFWEGVMGFKRLFRNVKLAQDLQKYWYDFRRLIGYYSSSEKDVLSFTDKHPGEACFIVGNGPSLTAADLEHIQAAGYTTFASNKIHKIYPQTDWRPDYLACIDKEVFQQNVYEILSNAACPIFLRRDLSKLVKKYRTLFGRKGIDVHYIRYCCKDKKETFYPQAANVISGGTVTFTMLELAWMMGFRTFYLIGCDHDYSSFGRKDTVGEAVACASNADYFAENYMRPGEVMLVGDLDKATRGYEAARKYIESHGGEIYNATRGGKLEVFERVDLDGLLDSSDVQ